MSGRSGHSTTLQNLGCNCELSERLADSEPSPWVH